MLSLLGPWSSNRLGCEEMLKALNGGEDGLLTAINRQVAQRYARLERCVLLFFLFFFFFFGCVRLGSTLELLAAVLARDARR